jgi:hypothetical protein
MYKNIYDTPEEIEVSFSVSDTGLYRLPLGRMFTTYEIYTGAGKTGTELIAGTDYIAGGESARAGEIKGESVYTGFQITNAGYHSTTLYATIYWVGSIVNAEVKNGKGIETITATTYTIDDFGLDVYEVNNGECTVTLPDLARWQGREITVRAITDATTGISIEAAGSDVITRADLTDVTLTSDGDFWVFFAGSTRWELTDGVESGEVSGRGSFQRKADGTMFVEYEDNTITVTTTNAAGNVFRSAPYSWTFPKSFVTMPIVSGFWAWSGAGGYTWGSIVGSSTGVNCAIMAWSYASSSVARIAVSATGRWYA